jgi:hypothetical protein
LNSSSEGTTTSRTKAASGAIGTAYRFHVRACNDAGCGPWTDSNTDTPTKPPRQVSLSKGASAAGLPGCTNGSCWYYNVDVAWFNPGTYTLNTYCDGAFFRSTSISVGSDGRGSYNGNWNNGGGYCGYGGVWVTVDGVESAHQNWG